jgi:hypothetical protein
MSKIIDYEIVDGETPEELRNRVKALLKEDWEIHGFLEYVEPLYLQVMIRREKLNEFIAGHDIQLV